MQNLSIDIIDKLYRANDTYINMKMISDIDASIEHAKNVSSAENDEKVFYKNKQFLLKLTRAERIEMRVSKRLDYLFSAMTDVRILDYLVLLSTQRGCITTKQAERIVKLIYDVRNLIGAFIKSDKKRYGY